QANGHAPSEQHAEPPKADHARPASAPPPPAPGPATAAGRQTSASGAPASGTHADHTTPASTEELLRERSSPLVRRIAKEHDVDISKLHGTGIAGRVTKADILAY